MFGFGWIEYENEDYLAKLEAIAHFYFYLFSSKINFFMKDN